jgi:thiopeptide-type bacteriocin biosynthesis protein
MVYQFAPYLLLRMPAKNAKDYTTDICAIISDPLFRTALSLASPVFYFSLKRADFNADNLSDKAKHTLLKYYNRFCFRPTPFGLFSSVTLAEWSEGHLPATDSHPEYRVIVHADQVYQNAIIQSTDKSALSSIALFEGNPSIYRALREFRFLRTGLEDNLKYREYQLQSIAFSKLLNDLISFCRPGKSRQEIVDHIIKAALCTGEEGAAYVDFLIDAQFLVNRMRPNISGKDYLNRLQERLRVKNQTPTSELPGIVSQLLTRKHQIEEKYFQGLKKDLKMLLPDRLATLAPEELSVIYYRDNPSETLGEHLRDKLRNGIDALVTLTPAEHLPAMTRFIKSYQQHFEGRSIPLLIALDPEIGIGYQQPATENNNLLLETLHIPPRPTIENSVNWTAAHSYLLENWHRINERDGHVIRLKPEELEKLKPAEGPLPILGMSVLFREAGDKVFIESAGGTNAPALLGRFTIADATIHSAARSMATSQEQQNPDVLFAELLHLADPHVDNVNRREQIWSYELPITAVSELPPGGQLELADLYLAVINNQVFLYSKKHGKFVIPRLTSAYNHGLNKLPLFRFLADLPYQYSRHNLALDLRQFFPGLGFYPRVEYLSAILYPATWILREKQLSLLPGAPATQVICGFKKLRRQLRLPAKFSMIEGDQQLVFHADRDADILFFINCIKQKEEVILQEFLGNDEVRQYNTYLIPDEPLRLPQRQIITHNLKTASSRIKRKYIPGSEWLYLKIYAPRISASRLLLRLYPLLRKRYKHGSVQRWFFIRYEDHAPHIRLRMQVNTEAISEILAAFKVKLEDRIQQQVIREFQIDVYSRELERYAAGGIENTEHFFWASSELVLHFLKQARTKTVNSTHAFALYSLAIMIRAFISDPEEQLDFTLISFQQFLPEFTDKPIKVDLDKKYRELAPGIMSAFQAADPALLCGSLKAGINFSQSLQVIPKHSGKIPDLDYLRSIIHMHLNRIFADESRKQEMICYYLLHKYLHSVKGRHKRSN